MSGNGRPSILKILMRMIDSYKKLSEAHKTAFVFASAIIFAVTLDYSLGFKPIYSYHMWATAALIFYIRQNSALRIVILLISILPVLYSYVGVRYGKIRMGYVASFFETNTLEWQEFLLEQKLTMLFVPVFLMTLLVLSLFSQKTKSVLKPTKIVFFSLSLVLFLTSDYAIFYRNLRKSAQEYIETTSEIARLSEDKNLPIVTKLPGGNKDIRVVIIGESARKDYFSVYGYPHKTTPFLDNASGIFIDGLTTPAFNTVSSLSVMLTAGGGGRLFSHNIVSISKAAGFDTYWLSNQGFGGRHERLGSFLAKSADYNDFLLNYGYEFKDDFVLPVFFEKILNIPSEKQKIVFVHTQGSHPNFCGKLFDYPVNFHLPYGKDINCYLATIEKTDALIKKFVDLLKDRKTSYSLLYFSDHGLGHDGSGDNMTLIHKGVRQAAEVPLIIIDSDITDHVSIKRTLSGVHFIDFFATWIGVKTDKTDSGYDLINFPESKNVLIKGKPLEEYENDPALF